MPEIDKNINAKIYNGKDTRGEVIYTISDNIIYKGDSTNSIEELDLNDFKVPRNLQTTSGGVVFVPGGVFASPLYFLKFDDKRNIFYTGKNGLLTNSIETQFTINYDRNSDGLALGTDDELIGILSFILDKKLEEISLINKTANDNDKDSSSKAA